MNCNPRARGKTSLAQHADVTLMTVRFQVTRYQSDPGQATAYMIGQLEIKKARKYANDNLDKLFSLQDFHYQVNLLFNNNDNNNLYSENLFKLKFVICWG